MPREPFEEDRRCVLDDEANVSGMSFHVPACEEHDVIALFVQSNEPVPALSDYRYV